jgi:tRNA(fMet)-specific endonuclease VapC
MKVLDTDTLTLLFQSQPKVARKHLKEAEPVVITIVTRIEVFQGRFASLIKAASGSELQRAYSRLLKAEKDLRPFPVLAINDASSTEFDRLLRLKGLKKVERGDLLIAAIVLANKATLVTRNVKHFRLIPGLSVENWAD